MKTHKLKLFVLTIVLLAAAPVISEASSATLLDDRTVLFTIDFSYSESVFDTQFPVTASAGVTYQDRVNEIGYILETEAKTSNTASSVSALLLSSDARIENGRYQLEKDATADFTLVIVATFTETLKQDYRAKITKIPYWLGDRRSTIHQNQLDELPKPVLEID